MNNDNDEVEEKIRREMGRGRRGKETKSYTLPPSPSHSFSSSSSSDFEFTISISPRKSSTALCPADELFYKGQLLPLHLSPRISMVRTLLLSSSSSSSSSTAPRDSTASSSNDSNSSFNTADLSLFPPDSDSSRPSSVTEDDEFKRLHNNPCTTTTTTTTNRSQFKKSTNKYFSLSRFSSVFRKDSGKGENVSPSGNSSVKRMSATAKEVIRKYLKKVKPLYEKLSQKQQQQQTVLAKMTERSVKETDQGDSSSGKRGRKENYAAVLSHSFSGNLRYPRRRSCVSSCPSSMRSSPSHSGVLSQRGVLLGAGAAAAAGGLYNYGGTSSMEELQSAIQGAITHCKNSLVQNNKTVVSNQINLI